MKFKNVLSELAAEVYYPNVGGKFDESERWVDVFFDEGTGLESTKNFITLKASLQNDGKYKWTKDAETKLLKLKNKYPKNIKKMSVALKQILSNFERFKWNKEPADVTIDKDGNFKITPDV